MSFQGGQGDSLTLGSARSLLPGPLLREPLTRALTSRLSHPQQVTQDGGWESAREHGPQMGVPKARQAWRGGPPASLEDLLLSALAQASRSQAFGHHHRSCFPQLFPSQQPSRSARVRGPCTEPQSGLCHLPPGGGIMGITSGSTPPPPG